MATYQYKVQTKSGTPYLYETSLGPTDSSKLSAGFKNTFKVEGTSFTQVTGGTYTGGKVTSWGTPVGAPPAAPAPKPVSEEQVTPYLQGVQASAMPAEVETRSLISEETKAEVNELLPETQAPAVPSLVDTYGGLREEYGVLKTEQEVADLKSAAREQDAIRRQRIAGEEGKAVAMGVIAGRVSEVERQEAERIDVINREIAYKTDQLNMAYNTISIMMDLTQKDYQNAVADYERQYNQNLQRINLFLEVEETKRDIATQQRTEALANWQIYANLITSGNISYASMPADQKLAINKLEVMAGLPIGFTAQIEADVDANILATNSLDDGRIQVFYRGKNGTIESKIYGQKVPKSYAPKEPSKPTEFEQKQGMRTEISEWLRSVAGTDGYVSPADFERAKNEYAQAGLGTKEQFTDEYWGFANPSHYKDYTGGV